MRRRPAGVAQGAQPDRAATKDATHPVPFGARNVLLVGQAVTGRTETVERYLRLRAERLTVIGTAAPLAQAPEAFVRLYEHGRLRREAPLPSFRPGRVGWYWPYLLPASYGLTLATILGLILRLRRRHDLFIGIGPFPALVGALLRRLGVVRRFVYYSIDYFPAPQGRSLAALVPRVMQRADAFAVRQADVVWHISPRIAEARQRFAGVPSTDYTHIVVPLGFSGDMLRSRDLDAIERWTIAFVGTSGRLHGFEVFLQALPKVIAALPQVRVRMIGSGPWEEFRADVAAAGLGDRFSWDGFFPDDHELFEHVSGCALGVAPYAWVADNPTLYADPGKPKLYAFCGLPSVVAYTADVAFELHARGAGLASPWSPEPFANAIIAILQDDATLLRFKQRAAAFARDNVSEAIFDRAFARSLPWLDGRA